jgi:hypothetical protein
VIELNDVKIESFPSYYQLDDMYVLLNDEKNTHTLMQSRAVLTNVLCLFSLPLPEMASKIKSTVSHCDSRPSNKAVCNREQGTHATLKETQCDTQDEYIYANINENTSSSSVMCF